ncbi:MAG: hypothetical protein GQ574_03530 [Crocinitomix sp.]|nr:hypothetical protein [Crocinitomix sp.]
MKYFFLFFLLISNLLYGQELIKGKYDSESNLFQQKGNSYWISEFEGDFAKFSKSGYYGIINKQGKIILPMEYDEVLITDSLLYAYNKNTHFVFSNTGELIDQPRFDFVIKRKGVLFFDVWQRYVNIEQYNSNTIDRIYQHGNTLYDFDGKFIADIPDNIRISFVQGIAAINNGHWKTKKYGYINKKGETILPIKYDFCTYFSNERGIVGLNEKRAIIDKQGNFITPFTSMIPAQSIYSSGLCRYKDSTIGKFAYIDTSGSIKIPPKYDKASNFSRGFAKVEENGKSYIIDPNGKEYINQQFEFEGGHRFMQYGNGVVYEDKNGKKLFDFKYEDHPSMIYYIEGLARIKLNGKQGIIDRLGNEIIPPIYDNVKIDQGYIMVRDNNAIWLMNKKGEKLMRIKDNASIRAKMISNYTILPEFNRFGFLKTLKEGKRGLINADAKEILPTNFERITMCEYYIQATKNDEIGIYNLEGELKVPHEKQRIVAITNKGFIIERERSLRLYDSEFNLKFTVDSIDLDYPSHGRVFSSGVYPYKIDSTGKRGFLDLVNLQKSKAIYDQLSFYGSHLILCKEKRKKTLYNLITNEKEIVDFEIDKKTYPKLLIIKKESNKPGVYTPGIGDFGEATQAWLYGVMNYAGEIVLPIQYSEIERISFFYDENITFPKGAVLFTNLKNKYVFINKQGHVIL